MLLAALAAGARAPVLPRVLPIGDSISMGYTLPVRALLQLHPARAVESPPRRIRAEPAPDRGQAAGVGSEADLGFHHPDRGRDRRAAALYSSMLNDLHRYALPRLEEIQNPNDVHFNAAGSGEMAAQVTTAVRKASGKMK